MKEAIEQIFQELQQLKATTQSEAEQARIRFLGKKGPAPCRKMTKGKASVIVSAFSER